MIRESHPPSFLWKEVPRRGGGWLPKLDEKKCETSAARIVIPSGALDLRYCMTAEQALEEGPRQRRRIECLVEAQISRTENDECWTSAARIVIPSAVEGSFLYSGKTVILG